MLIPFVIDADSLTPDPQWSPQTQRACYNDFLDAWLRAGLLAFDGDKFENSKLCEAVRALPVKFRQRVLGMLEWYPRINIPNWKGSVSINDMKLISSVAQIALVDDVRAEIEFGLGNDDDEASQLINEKKVTVCRLQAFRYAQIFQDTEKMANIHIEHGDTFQTIWKTRFNMLAVAPIKQISIVDRFAISQHIKCSQSHLSGLERFFKLLNECATGHRYITIYSAWIDELNELTINDIEVELQQLHKKYQKFIKKITIYMAPNKLFGVDAHDRFVRFDRYVWDLGNGLKVFEGPFSVIRSSASFVTGPSTQSYANVEQDIQNHKQSVRRDIG